MTMVKYSPPPDIDGKRFVALEHRMAARPKTYPRLGKSAAGAAFIRGKASRGQNQIQHYRIQS
jgi:hypothetical protein